MQRFFGLAHSEPTTSGYTAMTDLHFPHSSTPALLKIAPMRVTGVHGAAVLRSLPTDDVAPWTIRRLGVEDSVPLAKLRLSMAAEDPVPLGSSFEEELVRPLKSFWDLLSREEPNATFGAFDRGQLVGVVSISLNNTAPSFRHKCDLWGVLVSSSHRRQGIGRAIMKWAIEHAWAHKMHRINLQVFSTNTRASALYRSLGFVEYGCEPDSLFMNDRYVDSRLMSLVNDQASD